jgi:hypothetical protein
MGFESLSWSDATFVVCDNVMADIALRQLLTTIIDIALLRKICRRHSSENMHFHFEISSGMMLIVV